MSKFKTVLVVDVNAVISTLPTGAYVHGVEWDEEQKQVVINWEDDRFQTPYDFPVEFSQEHLAKQKLPEGVRFKGPAKVAKLPRLPVSRPPATPEGPVVETAEELAKKQPGTASPELKPEGQETAKPGDVTPGSQTGAVGDETTTIPATTIPTATSETVPAAVTTEPTAPAAGVPTAKPKAVAKPKRTR